MLQATFAIHASIKKRQVVDIIYVSNQILKSPAMTAISLTADPLSDTSCLQMPFSAAQCPATQFLHKQVPLLDCTGYTLKASPASWL